MTAPPFDEMNETDVRESILRPLLHDLGYKLGTSANIRTEINLAYDRIFLGHKKKSDPALVGRADYLCEVVGVASWVAEAKSPRSQIVQADVHQAHSYAQHPEINATYFLLSNGRSFRLYQTSRLAEPILSFDYAEIQNRLPDLLKVLSPSSIRERHLSPLSPRLLPILHTEAGLAPGWGPTAKIMGGHLTYKGVRQAEPEKQSILRSAIGKRAIIVGDSAYRTDSGQIRIDLKIVQSLEQLDRFAQVLGMGTYGLACAAPSISVDVDTPNIFAGQAVAVMPPNLDLTSIPGMPAGTTLPWPVQIVVDIRAVAFLSGDLLRGTFEYETSYSIDLANVPESVHNLLEKSLTASRHSMWGEFETRLMPQSSI